MFKSQVAETLPLTPDNNYTETSSSKLALSVESNLINSELNLEYVNQTHSKPHHLPLMKLSVDTQQPIQMSQLYSFILTKSGQDSSNQAAEHAELHPLRLLILMDLSQELQSQLMKTRTLESEPETV